MKSFGLIFIMLFTAFLLNAQVIDTTYFDRNWEQTTAEAAHYYRIISIDTAESFRFYVEDFYPDGRIQMTGTYKSIRPDNKDGRFVYWFKNGQKQMLADYRDNVLHGTLKEWYESGQLQSEQHYRDGRLDGSYRTWQENGHPRIVAHYVAGEKHGHFSSFYDNGQKVRDDYFENGELIDGQCYDEQGDSVAYFPYVLLPEFRGGRSGLREFIATQLQYPPEARRRGIEGLVVVLFTVDEDGQVNDPQVVNGDRSYFNEEALRVIRLSPPWKPGEVDGVPSPIQITVPIEFRLR